MVNQFLWSKKCLITARSKLLRSKGLSHCPTESRYAKPSVLRLIFPRSCRIVSDYEWEGTEGASVFVNPLMHYIIYLLCRRLISVEIGRGGWNGLGVHHTCIKLAYNRDINPNRFICFSFITLYLVMKLV